MKRDMNLIRDILLEIEKLPAGESDSGLEIPGRDQREVVYHAHLLIDAGFVDGIFVAGPGGGPFCAHRLTWAGHEFLDAARSETIWKNTMQRINETTGAVAIPVLVELLSATTRKALGLDSS
ncbi:MAG: DUF2513 domain-containing protein [Pirellulaceae bacterium]